MAAKKKPQQPVNKTEEVNAFKEDFMSKVTSKDGTTIAFDKTGEGQAVILVASALSDRSGTTKLAALLAEHFTVINYDRRGRGESGDTQPFAEAFFHNGARALANLLPNAEHRILQGQHHGSVVMAPKAIASELVAFFKA